MSRGDKRVAENSHALKWDLNIVSREQWGVMLFRSSTILLALFAVACSSSLKSESMFPSEIELEELMSTSPEAPPPERQRVRHVEHWVIQQPAVMLGSTKHEATSSAEVVLAKATRRLKGVIPTESMHCVAREFGLFWRQYQAYPNTPLKTFIYSRCGVGTAIPHISVSSAKMPDEAIKALLVDTGNTLSHEVGVWSETDELGRTLTLTASGLRLVDIEPISTSEGQDGSIVLKGSFLLPESSGSAYITRSGLGFQECTPDPRVEAPRFSLICPVDPKDPAPTIELMTSIADSMLGTRALLATFAPGSTLDPNFTAPRLMQASQPMEGGTPMALVGAINEARRLHQMRPLRTEAQQSGVTGRLLPKYFEALRHGDLRTAETILIGLLAGWGVGSETPIRNGDFLSFVISGEESASTAIASTLMLPSARATLLDPEAASIALSTIASSGGASFPTIITTYKFFDGVDLESASSRILDALDAERHAVNLKPVIRVQGGNTEKPMQRVRQRLREGKDPERAFEWALDRIATEAGISMGGTINLYMDLRKVEFPEALLTQEIAQVDLDVDYYRPSDSPWGFYTVIMFYAP